MNDHLEPVTFDERLVRAPDPGLGAIEECLDEANRRAEQDSVSFLDRNLPGISFRDLGQRTDGGTLTVTRSSEALLERLDGGALLERLLRTQDLGGPRLKLVRDGSSVDAGAAVDEVGDDAVPVGRAAAGRVATMLDEGTTLVLDGIDLKDAALRRFTEHVERALHTIVNINGYVSLRPQQSFGPHWDDHEVVVVHLLGRKHWDVRAPTVLSPAAELYDQNATGPRAWSGVIDPGTVLHLPRGWGHDVTGTDELTFHLTVTIPRLRVNEVLQRSLDRAGRLDVSSELVPCAADHPLPDARVVRERLGDVLGPTEVSVAAAARSARTRSRYSQGLTGLLRATAAADAARVWFRAPHPGGVMVADDPDAEHVLAFGRRAVRASAGALEVLAPYLDARAHPVADVVAANPGRAAAGIVTEALRVGLIEVTEADGHGVLDGL